MSTSLASGTFDRFAQSSSADGLRSVFMNQQFFRPFRYSVAELHKNGKTISTLLSFCFLFFLSLSCRWRLCDTDMKRPKQVRWPWVELVLSETAVCAHTNDPSTAGCMLSSLLQFHLQTRDTFISTTWWILSPSWVLLLCLEMGRGPSYFVSCFRSVEYAATDHFVFS